MFGLARVMTPTVKTEHSVKALIHHHHLNLFWIWPTQQISQLHREKDLDSLATDPERYFWALLIAACFLSETAPAGLTRVSLRSKTKGKINKSGIRLSLTNQGAKAVFYAVHIDCNSPVEPIGVAWGLEDFRHEGKLYLWRNANEQREKHAKLQTSTCPTAKERNLAVIRKQILNQSGMNNKNGSLQIQWCLAV